MNELKFNVVQSIGEITANFDEFKNQVSQELEKYKSKEFTEDTKKDAKKDLAELRKKKAAVNERRIEVKKEYMKPYDEFEAKVKELITLIDEPITLIDYKVKEFEEKRINERKEEILLAYEEIVPGELQDYIGTLIFPSSYLEYVVCLMLRYAATSFCVLSLSSRKFRMFSNFIIPSLYLKAGVRT